LGCSRHCCFLLLLLLRRLLPLRLPLATTAPRLGLLVLILTFSSSPLLLLPWLVLASSPLVFPFAFAARSLPLVLPVRPLGSQKRNEHRH
jgi:hypothetical protein